MAIRDNEAAASSTAPQASAAPVAYGAAPAQQSSDTRWSFHNSGPLGRAPMGKNLGSEILTKLQKTLAEIYTSADARFEFTLIPVDNNNEVSLAFSALVVCVRDKAAKDVGVSYYTMILEATGEKIPVRFETINNRQIEIVRVPGDAVDEELMRIVHSKVAAAFPNQEIFSADAMVIPSAFNVDDKAAVYALAVNASMADFTEINMRSPGFTDLNLANAKQDSNLLVRLTFDKSMVENAAGEPQRSDVKVDFTSQQNQQQQNRSLNSGDRVTKVAQLSGFVDVLWAPVQTQMGMAQYAMPQQNPMMNQKYVSRLVLTDVQSNYSTTLPSYLLAIVTALSVRDDNNWYNVFKSSPSYSNESLMHDVGALNIEANMENNANGIGTRIDTRKDTFSIADLAKLLAMTIRPGLVISMDVPDCGPQTWYTSVFAAASNGSRAATDAIFNAAMQLTNGAFGRHFQPGQQMFTDQGNRVHLGTYIGSSGVKRDIRDIDYLAVMNMTNDVEVIRKWSDTFNATGIPLAERLAQRKQIITGIASNAEINGFATRVTFTEGFLKALSLACAEAGLVVRIDTATSGIGFQNDRGAAGFVDTALNQMGQGGFFNRGSVGGGQAFNNQFNNYSRWS